MTATASATDVWAERYAGARSQLPGDGHVAERRQAAMADLTATGFPTQRDEDWLYTSLAPLVETPFGTVPPLDDAALERGAALLRELPPTEDGAVRRVFVDGRVAPPLGSSDDLPDGLEIRGLAEALASGDEDLETRLGTLVDGRGHAVAALNTALFEDGVLVRVRAGTRIPTPVELVFLATGDGAPTAVHPRLVYVVEDDAQVAVVERWRGRGSGLSNVALEAWVGANGRLDLLDVQEQSTEALHFRSQEVRLAQDAHFAGACLTIGARLARNDVRVRLEGTGAECRLDGVTLVQGSQHADHQTYIDHAKPHGTSHQLYKGILDDHARSVFSGRVLVEPHAQKTDARQANHSLILSPDAVADAKPQLEIFADDVKCAHGATVGQLDEDALFYLRSRGLAPREARRLLLHAFASEIVERMQHGALAGIARSVLDAHLPGGGS